MIVMIEKKIREACRVCDCGKTKCEDKTQRVGFTLVELLVVVAIIGILATLITAAAFRVTSKARETTIRMKINQLESALEQYKIKFGEYPPNISDANAVARHIKKRWPRATVTTIPAGNTKDSLAFWLGGYRNSDGKYCGFGANQSNPFMLTLPGYTDPEPIADEKVTISGVDVHLLSEYFDNEVFIELNEDDVKLDNGHLRVVINSGSSAYPVIYFRGKKGGGGDAYWDAGGSILNAITSCGNASPYLKSVDTSRTPPDGYKWHNPETYQLIHPGQDGKFGTTAADMRRTDGTGLTGGDDCDYDNITNLGTSTIEALLP
ncbi:MAG: prepilin-type N-terminal cleavage/methylation domain-containing protein [Planctomycetaceae bacterium]|jgi:prepilin-type N-terminal cleavage/methylation domain-containing protein|nr:prepilin-type N-terminal cleavage/methylation domain-containing protein [Planctomycetaceae bacterium]